MKQAKFPPGWDEKKVQEVIAHYERQTEEEAVAEYEAAFSDPVFTVVIVPVELLPAIRQLLAKHDAAKRKAAKSRAQVIKKRKRA